jgi:hypothetical protein
MNPLRLHRFTMFSIVFIIACWGGSCRGLLPTKKLRNSFCGDAPRPRHPLGSFVLFGESCVIEILGARIG